MSQTDWEADVVFSCAAGDTSQTLVDAEGGSAFVGLGVVSHTVELGEEVAMGGRSFVGGEI